MTSATGKGFTLLELILVVVIIGIAGGIIIPGFNRSYEQIVTKGFSQQVQDLTVYAHNRGIYERNVYELSLLESSHDVKIQVKKLNADQPAKQLTVPIQLSIRIQPEKIYFYPDGTIDPSTISISSRLSKTIVLSSQGVYGKFKTQ